MIELFHAFRDALYEVLKFFQQLTEPLLGSQSYWFSIVMLTIAVRILLIPLTVKQVRSTRAMQELAPEIKKLQAKYKNDRPKLTEETMNLYKERGFNPMAGCWPLLAQAPFFFALYHVIYSDNLSGEPNILHGKSFFGVPLEDRWFALDWAHRLGSVDGLVILGLILAMSLTTYISQKQLLSRQGASAPPQQQMLIKILPFTFLIFAVNVPLAIIIYWVTTNLWSMGQQYVLLRNAPPPPGAEETPVLATANGSDGKSAGPFSFFRSLLQPGGNAETAPSPNGGSAKKAGANRPASKDSAKAGTDSKATPAGKPEGGTTKERRSKGSRRSPARRHDRVSPMRGLVRVSRARAAGGLPVGVRAERASRVADHAEASAKTVEAAAAAAAAQLGLRADQVDVEVLEEPVASTFGVVGSPARVRVAAKPVPTPVTASVQSSTLTATSPPEVPRQDSSRSRVESAAVPQRSRPPRPAGEADGEPVDEETIATDTELAADFIEGLLDVLDLDGDITTWIDATGGHVDVEGVALDMLVGVDGEVLSALQELTRLAVLRQTRHRPRVHVDVGGFKARRQQELADMSRTMARRVVETGNPERLRPMTPFERKIVHDAVRDVDGAITESVGEEPQRSVIILPAR